MCFSATASFAASAGLAGAGIATYYTADTKHKLLASIPFLFAVQQGIEGIQWLSAHPGDCSLASGYLYLFFALLLWPVYIPWVVSKIDAKRHDVMRWFIWFGAVISMYLFVVLMYHPLRIGIFRHSISYALDVPLVYQVGVSYVFVVCGSLIASSKSEIRWFGAITFAAALVSALFYFETFTSVWCFLAALLSSLIYFYVRRESKKQLRFLNSLKNFIRGV